MRRTAVIAAFALVASLVFGAPSSAGACASDVYLRNYKITMEPSQSSYRMGDRDEITLTLTRKDTGAPVAGNDIAIGLYQPDYTNYKTGATDRRGTWVARFVLDDSRFQPGSVTGSAYAETKSGDSTFCAAIVEYGYKREKGLFTIRK